MVDEHDPEKRAGSLRRSFQLADQIKAPDLPPVQPPQPQPASATAKTGDGGRTSAQKWYRYKGSLRDVLCVLGAVGLLIGTSYFVYEYRVGTPTTARVDHCDVFRGNWYTLVSNSKCRGTWSVGGQSQTGTIQPPFQAPFWSRSVGPRDGSSLHVRAHDGTAVTLSATFYEVLAFCAFLLAASLPGLWRAWRGRNRG
jgi:hypothetical protein